MSPRPDRRAERLPQILRAAMAVFARSGFAQARMEDIAQEAGLAKATLYLYFPGKDEVIAALLQQYFAAAFDDLAALRGAPGSLRARLGDWSERRIAELEAEAAYLGIGYEFFAVAARQPAAREVLRGYYSRYRGELTALLAEGAAPGASPPDLAAALVAFYEGLTMLWMLEPEGVELRRVTAQALDRLLGPAA
jgi:TetR/AcrR family fatty acid metabolism transcriptional regulator